MKKPIAILSAALAALFLISPISACALAARSATGGTVTDLNYSDSNEYSLRATVSPSDLLSTVLRGIDADSAPLSDAEKAYLNDYFGDTLTYSYTLPSTLVKAEQTDTSPISLKVSAKEYSYVGANGGTVTWSPVSVVCGGRTLTPVLSPDGSYTALFEGLDEGIYSVTVEYCGHMDIPKEIINRLINYAYADAVSAKAAYEREVAYTAALAEYNAYLSAKAAYNVDNAKYEAYLKEKSVYDAAYEAYTKNQAEWVEYEKKKQKYDTYVIEYNKYLEDIAAYRTNYEAYKANSAAYSAYVTNVAKVRTAMNAMESLFIKPKNYNCLYQALQNAEMIALFEKYKSVLSAAPFNIPSQTITDLRAYADELNVMLGEYAEAREVSEKAAFEYYKANYAELCERFNYLYDKMTEILSAPLYVTMCGKLDLDYDPEMAEYKERRIKMVLSHIYLICQCLEDDRHADGTWAFYNDEGDPHTYYFADLLPDTRLVITDTDAADPSSLSWVDEVIPMSAPVFPTAPAVVQKPVEPEKISKPTEPVAVQKPTAPTVVQAPTPLSSDEHALILKSEAIRAALASGAIGEREGVGEDVSFTAPKSSSIVKYTSVSSAATPTYVITLSYMSDIGQTNASITAEQGDAFPESSLPTPVASYTDEEYSYAFRGWSTSATELIAPPSQVSEDITLYSLYTKAKRSYSVQFRSEGEIFHQTSCNYGQEPTFPSGTPSKPSDERNNYTFVAWERTLYDTQNAKIEYTAKFSSSERTYTVDFKVGDQKYTKYYKYADTPVPPIAPSSYIDGTYLYTFTSWAPTLSAVTCDTTYEASFSQTALASLTDTEGSLELENTATAYKLTSSKDCVEISGLVSLAKNEGKRVDILFSEDGSLVSLGTDALASMKELGAAYVLLLSDRGEAGKGVGVNITNAAGKTLDVDGGIRLTFKDTLASATALSVRATFAAGYYSDDIAYSADSEAITLVASSGTYYKPLKKFNLTIADSEGGSAFSAQTVLASGDEISFSIYPDAQYTVGAITLTDASGKQSVSYSQGDKIVMPEWDAKLSVEFLPIEYTVQFVYHEGTLTEKYRLGDTVKLPTITSSFEEDGFFYTFIGWSSPVSIVTGDAVYTAKYYSVRIEEASDSGSGGNTMGAIVTDVAIPMAFSVFMYIAAVTVPLSLALALTIIIISKRKKNKKPKDKE